NLAALDQHVGLLEVSDRAVEAEHAAALDQDRAPRRGCAWLLGAGGADHSRGGDGGGRRGGGGLAARQRGRRIARAARAERAADGTAKMRHGVLPNECCCAERCYPCSAEAPSETAPGCDAGVGRCPPRPAIRRPHRRFADQGPTKSKGARDIVTRSRQLASSRRAVAPGRRAASW